MEEIAYDIPLHYPLPPKNVEWGEVGAHAAVPVDGGRGFYVSVSTVCVAVIQCR